MKLLKWLFGSRKPALNKPAVISSITCGERDEKGFADLYVNGKKKRIQDCYYGTKKKWKGCKK